MLKKWFGIIIGALLIFALGFSVNQLLAKDDKGAMTDQEAKKFVESLYGGKVKTLIQSGNQFNIEMENELGDYTVQVNRTNGEIESLVLNEKREAPAKEPEPEQNEEPKVKIGEKKAAEIAQTKIKGKIDDIDLEEMDGSYVYIVEIETENDEEVLVYVQAYTGEILNYTYEK